MISLKWGTLGTLFKRAYFFFGFNKYLLGKELTYSRSLFLKKNDYSVRINSQFKKETNGTKREYPD